MEYWVASDDIHKIMRELIGQHHPDLAPISDKIVLVFREKAGKSGGKYVYGTARRGNALANALANEDWAFVLELAADQWEHELTARQREALVDSLLCACRAEEDEKSGEPKLQVVRPDVSVFRENVERYGMWFPKEPTENETDDGSSDRAFEELVKNEG